MKVKGSWTRISVTKITDKTLTDFAKWKSDFRFWERMVLTYLVPCSTSPPQWRMQLPVQLLLSEMKQRNSVMIRLSYFCRTSFFIVSECGFCTMLYRSSGISGSASRPSVQKTLSYFLQNWTLHCSTCMHLANAISEIITVQLFSRTLNSYYFFSLSSTHRNLKTVFTEYFFDKTVQLHLKRSPFCIQLSHNSLLFLHFRNVQQLSLSPPHHSIFYPSRSFSLVNPS